MRVAYITIPGEENENSEPIRSNNEAAQKLPNSINVDF